jgi:AraC-like DNA-binding protein
MTNNRRFVFDLKQLVESNYKYADFNVNKLCNILNISRASMYRKTIYTCQCTPQEYIENVRLEIAAEKMKENDILIKEIAYEVGYNDPKHFSKLFKQKFGTTPMKYKKEAVLFEQA